MEPQSRITRVVLENYKSIAFCDVKLGPLTFLVGPNGAGKSNFLDALQFLSQATSGPTFKAFQDRGGFFRVIRRGSTSDAYIGIRVEFVTAIGASGFYAARFHRLTRSEYTVAHERCWLDRSHSVNGYEVRNGRFTAQSNVPGQNFVGLDQLHLPIAASAETFKPVFDLLQGFHHYGFNPKDFRQPIPSDVANVLAADGGNLANVVSRMALQYPDVFARVVEYLQVILPVLDSVGILDLPEYRAMEFVLAGSHFSPREMSDGTLRSLAVLVALFQRHGGASGVQLVALEEPEGAVHPAAAGVLFDAMREASIGVQVIAATHSADLLDNKDIDSDTILPVEFQEGTTRLGRLDQTGRETLRKRLYTTGELMRMNYLRPEPETLPSEPEMESLLFGDLVPA